MGGCFAALALCYNLEASSGWKFAVFCILTFSLNWGPNVGTYVVPAEIYPVEIKSTFHGLSAASGKLGALAGTLLFTAVSDAYGFAAVLWMQVAVSALCVYVSWRFIPEPGATVPSIMTHDEEERLQTIHTPYKNF